MVFIPNSFLPSKPCQTFIPVSADLSRVICALEELDEIFVQSHHPYGSLATRMDYNSLARSLEPVGSSASLQIDLNSLDIAAARASVANCECCGSPGYLCFYNRQGERFLKFGIPSEVDIDFWSTIVATITSTSSPRAYRTEASRPFSSINAPKNAKIIPLTKSGFFRLITDFGQIAQALQFALPQKGMTIRNEFAVEQINDNHGIISFSGGASGFELNLPKVKHFALSPLEQGSALLLLDDLQKVILEISLNSSNFPAASWEASIQHAMNTFNGSQLNG